MSRETEFAVFCVENYKYHRHLTGKQTVELFNRFGVFDYLREFYDVLHTAGHRHINRDIDEYLSVRTSAAE